MSCHPQFNNNICCRRNCIFTQNKLIKNKATYCAELAMQDYTHFGECPLIMKKS